MNCHDVRQALAAPSRGGLTEQALVHAHVAQCEDCRKVQEALQPVEPSGGASSFAASLTRAAEVGRTGAERAGGLLTRVLPMVSARSVRVAAILIGHVRFGWLRSSVMIVSQRAARVAIDTAGVSGQAAVRGIEVVRAGVARVGDLPTRVRRVGPSLTVACQWTARAVIEPTGAAATQIRVLLTRFRTLVSTSFTGFVEAAGRLIAASLTDSGRVLSSLGGRASQLRQITAAPWARPRLLLRVSAGIVGLAGLVAALVFLWPPQWPDKLVDRTPALAKTSAPVTVSEPEPIRVEVSRPEPARVTVRPRPSETPAEIPAPVRRSEPALVPSRATASAPMPAREPTQTTQTSEADPTAAIDWLLKGASGRRNIESP